MFGGVYGMSAVVTISAVITTALGPGSRWLSASSRPVVLLLAANLGLILALTAASGIKVFEAFGERTPDAGARLHRRFVSLFAVAAVVPAVIVALFFGLLVTRGVDEWFSTVVRTAVENAADVSRVYVAEQTQVVQRTLVPVAEDLNRVAAQFTRSRLGFSSRVLLFDMVSHDFAAVYLIDSQGRVLARAEQSDAPPYLAPPQAMLRARGADAPLRLDASDMARAVFRLSAYPDAYVYVVRPLGEGSISRLRRSERSVEAYRQTEQRRQAIQSVFILSYTSAAFLVLIGAVWLGMAAANQVAAPVARLVQAADRISSGDLDTRVPLGRQLEELTVLTRAFNRMTSDLQTQQAALRTASLEAQDRRRFIEAVLSGVSAGVIGLDSSSVVSAINGRALQLLGLSRADDALGLALEIVAPEFVDVASKTLRGQGDAESEFDLVRSGESRRLRVRASGGEAASTGLVLTFDDITRLLAAQRNAAWRDVARRIAHEIKNPLTPIQLSAERIRRKYRREITSDLETFDRCTETIIRQVGDIGRMVDEFSSFARMPAPTFSPENAAELLQAAVFAQRVAYPEIEVELAEPTGAEAEVTVMADARMLRQALANVLKNAGEATAARTAATPGVKGRIRARLALGAERVIYVVEDNGVGLPTRDRARLTEPYVTTREKGTGLGLAIVKRIMEEHGGELTLGDASDLPGARVTLDLPRRHPPADPV